MDLKREHGRQLKVSCWDDPTTHDKREHGQLLKVSSWDDPKASRDAEATSRRSKLKASQSP